MWDDQQRMLGELGHRLDDIAGADAQDKPRVKLAGHI